MDHEMEQEMSVQPVFGKKGLALLIFALLFSFGYQFIHPTILSRDFTHMPGIGLTISQWALLAISLLLGREKLKDIKDNWQGIFLLICAVLLGACYAIFGNDSLRLMNLPVLIFVTAQGLFSLLKVNTAPSLSGEGLWESFRRLFPSSFAHFALPFRALSYSLVKDKKKFTGLGMGLLFSLVAAFIAVSLLSSADSFFNNMITGSVQSIEKIDGLFVIRLLIMLLGALMLFSLLYSAVIQPREMASIQRPVFPALTLSMMLSMLALVYGLFVYVQFRHLFGNQETALSSGGYAEYARSGFFQLVLLSVLTLCLILPSLTQHPRHGYLRLICALVALLTVIINFSAFFRMRLYIQAYGLSLLRVVTLWGMAMIFIALMMVIAKCIFPHFRLSVPLAVVVLSSWLMLNFSNVDLQIAQYNVRAYNSGALTKLDAYYFTNLSPDVLPVLDEIADEALREDTKKEFHRIMKQIYPAGYDWALCWGKIEQ